MVPTMVDFLMITGRQGILYVKNWRERTTASFILIIIVIDRAQRILSMHLEDAAARHAIFMDCSVLFYSMEYSCSSHPTSVSDAVCNLQGKEKCCRLHAWLAEVADTMNAVQSVRQITFDGQ